MYFLSFISWIGRISENLRKCFYIPRGKIVRYIIRQLSEVIFYTLNTINGSFAVSGLISFLIFTNSCYWNRWHFFVQRLLGIVMIVKSSRFIYQIWHDKFLKNCCCTMWNSLLVHFKSFSENSSTLKYGTREDSSPEVFFQFYEKYQSATGFWTSSCIAKFASG